MKVVVSVKMTDLKWPDGCVENWTALFAQGATESQSKPCTKSPLQYTFTPLTCELILGSIAFEHHPLEKMIPVVGDLIPKKINLSHVNGDWRHIPFIKLKFA